MKALTVIVASLAVVYIAYVVAEKIYHARLRKKLKKVIHVNGIRGKSTVARLIDAGLRECGIRVYSKTTGTVPSVIDTNGTEKPIRRYAPANIREQLSVLRAAVKENAEVLVVECMAVNPELQYVCEHRILHSDIVVITNVREDHLDEMGETPESIAYSLANTVPEGGTLVLGENDYVNIFERVADKTGAKVVVADSFDGDPMDTFAENIAVALKVCETAGLERSTFLRGMKKYNRDPGALAEFQYGDTVFINGFSINDPQSTLAVYDKITKKYPAEETTVLLNCRGDRAFRVEQHIKMLTKMPCKKAIITGSNRDYVKNRLMKEGIKAENLKKYEDLIAEKYVFGCGNIAADGMKIIRFFKENGEVQRG